MILQKVESKSRVDHVRSPSSQRGELLRQKVVQEQPPLPESLIERLVERGHVDVLPLGLIPHLAQQDLKGGGQVLPVSVRRSSAMIAASPSSTDSR